MKNSEATALILHLWSMSKRGDYLPMLMWGESGVGKSATVKQAQFILAEQEEDHVQMIDLRLGEMEPGDLIGLPEDTDVYPDPIAMLAGKSPVRLPEAQLVDYVRTSYPEMFEGEEYDQIWTSLRAKIKDCCEEMVERRSVYAMPDWFPEPGTQGILFLDEINRTTQDTQQAVFQLMLERQMHSMKLPSGWIIIAAANPPYSVGEQGRPQYDVEDFDDKALLSRFLHIGLIPDPAEWLDYARKKGIDQTIREIIADEKTLLGPLEVEPPEVEPTPRSWSLLAKVLPGLSPEMTREVSIGIIGIAATDGLSKERTDTQRVLDAAIRHADALLPKLRARTADALAGDLPLDEARHVQMTVGDTVVSYDVWKQRGEPRGYRARVATPREVDTLVKSVLELNTGGSEKGWRMMTHLFAPYTPGVNDQILLGLDTRKIIVPETVIRDVKRDFFGRLQRQRNSARGTR